MIFDVCRTRYSGARLGVRRAMTRALTILIVSLAFLVDLLVLGE